MGKNGREVMWGRHDKSNVWSIGQWVNKALMHSSPNPENRTDWSINQSIMAHIYHLILKTDNQLTDQSIMAHIHHLILKTDNQLTDQSIMAHIHHLILKTDNQLTDQSIMIHTQSSPNPKNNQLIDQSINYDTMDEQNQTIHSISQLTQTTQAPVSITKSTWSDTSMYWLQNKVQNSKSFLFFFCPSMWTDQHQNTQHWSWLVTLIGLENMCFLQACKHTFQPRNLTGWSNEGVH